MCAWQVADQLADVHRELQCIAGKQERAWDAARLRSATWMMRIALGGGSACFSCQQHPIF